LSTTDWMKNSQVGILSDKQAMQNNTSQLSGVAISHLEGSTLRAAGCPLGARSVWYDAWAIHDLLGALHGMG